MTAAERLRPGEPDGAVAGGWGAPDGAVAVTAGWYLPADCLICFEYQDYSPGVRMTMRAGREGRNVGAFLRKELGDRAEEHRKILG